VSWLVLPALLVAAFTVLVRLLEPKIAFYPYPGESVTAATLGVPLEPHTVTTGDGERLRVWRLPHHAPRAQVVYFHGNGGNPRSGPMCWPGCGGAGWTSSRWTIEGTA
jgi:hypothetical protein